MIDMIRSAKEPITLIAVGPAPNLEAQIVERLTRTSNR
jgi:inosine-uridine nucleoside N-ribohydrolase